VLITSVCYSQDNVEPLRTMIHPLIAGMIHQPAGPAKYSHVLPGQEPANIACCYSRMLKIITENGICFVVLVLLINICNSAITALKLTVFITSIIFLFLCGSAA